MEKNSLHIFDFKPDLLPDFLCPMCGHNTLRFAVVCSATYNAKDTEAVVVENDEKPWIEAATCAACGVPIDVLGEVEAAINASRVWPGNKEKN